MNPGVPKEGGRGHEVSADPLQEAERAFEEHEGDLVEEVIALAQRGVPEDATVGEAMIEMRRAMREDPEVHDLIQRLLAMTLYGGGRVIANWPEWWRENRPLE